MSAESALVGPRQAGIVNSPPAGSPATVREALPIFLRHGSPRILIVATVVAAGIRASLGAPGLGDVLVVAGLLAFWPFQEWLIHVFILHFRPRQIGRWTIDFRVPRKHRAHHRDPWNYEILFIPMQSFLYSLPLVGLLWYAVTPSPALAWTGILGHVALGLHYEWIHFLIHTRVSPRSRFYRALWRHHRLHHFKNEHYWFGVTRTEADWILRTRPAPDRVALSPTARTLIGDAE